MDQLITEETIDLTPRPTKSERAFARERGLNERLFDAAAKITKTNVIAVVGPQGGAGKTRITFALGSALAQLCGLNVIAMDLDDDYGALLDLVPERTRMMRSFDSISDHDGIIPFPKLRACLSVTRSRMMVLRGPEKSTDALDQILIALGNADVVLLDCAAGVDRPRARWALERADQVVVVARPEPSGARNAAAATDQALHDLDVVGTLVINRQPNRADVTTVETAFAMVSRIQQVVHMPEDRRFARNLENTTYRLERLRTRSRLAIKDLSSIIADGLR